MKDKLEKYLLIGAGVVVVAYLLWKKSQNQVSKTQYSKECLDRLELALQSENVKPANFEKDFLESCQKKVNQLKNMSIKSGGNLGMPQVKPATPEEEKAMRDILLKSLPDEFTIKQSANSNVRYYKGNNQDFYKVPYILNSFSGVMPIKISLAEYSDAYVKFKNQPK